MIPLGGYLVNLMPEWVQRSAQIQAKKLVFDILFLICHTSTIQRFQHFFWTGPDRANPQKYRGDWLSLDQLRKYRMSQNKYPEDLISMGTSINYPGNLGFSKILRFGII